MNIWWLLFVIVLILVLTWLCIEIVELKNICRKNFAIIQRQHNELAKEVKSTHYIGRPD